MSVYLCSLPCVCVCVCVFVCVCTITQVYYSRVAVKLASTYLKGDTKSILIIRGTYYQGWVCTYMRCTQGQNEEYLLSRSIC